MELSAKSSSPAHAVAGEQQRAAPAHQHTSAVQFQQVGMPGQAAGRSAGALQPLCCRRQCGSKEQQTLTCKVGAQQGFDELVGRGGVHDCAAHDLMHEERVVPAGPQRAQQAQREAQRGRTRSASAGHGRRARRAGGPASNRAHTPTGATSASRYQVVSPWMLNLGVAVQPPHAAHMRIP